jgi:hypothetical protein
MRGITGNFYNRQSIAGIMVEIGDEDRIPVLVGRKKMQSDPQAAIPAAPAGDQR